MHKEPTPEDVPCTDSRPADRDEAASVLDSGADISVEFGDGEAEAALASFTAGEVPSEATQQESPLPGSDASLPLEALLAAIHELGASLSQQLVDLKGSVDRELRAEAAREKVVDRLHAELQEYKQDLLLSMMRPVFLDLIQLHDDIGKILDAHEPPDLSGEAVDSSDEPAAPVNPDAPRPPLLGLVAGIRQGIEDILYRQGVEPFTTMDDGFDARRQRVVSTVPTDDPQRVRSVAARLRQGFRAGERIIRPEIVTVYSTSVDSPR